MKRVGVLQVKRVSVSACVRRCSHLITTYSQVALLSAELLLDAVSLDELAVEVAEQKPFEVGGGRHGCVWDLYRLLLQSRGCKPASPDESVRQRRKKFDRVRAFPAESARQVIDSIVQHVTMVQRQLLKPMMPLEYCDEWSR